MHAVLRAIVHVKQKCTAMADPNRDTHALKAELKRLREGLWISDYVSSNIAIGIALLLLKQEIYGIFTMIIGREYTLTWHC